MIHITTTTTGLLIQKDDLDVQIDRPAIRETLPILIGVLIDSTKALAAARRSGYEDGLRQGYANCDIQHATSERIAERQAGELVEALAGCQVASAA